MNVKGDKMNLLNATSEKTRQLEQILVVSTFTTFMGQIYFAPFGTEFRLTLAVVVLNVLMLTFQELNAFWTINIVGILMFIVRSTLHFMTMHSTVIDAVKLYYPVLFFYIFYSIFFVSLNVRKKLKRPLLLFLGIWFCDSIPNIIEVLIRHEWMNINFESAVYTIVVIGLFRSVFTVILIYISNRYYDHVKQRQEMIKFRESLMRNANLKTELFFLRKSKKDIENAMEKSFSIYERYKDHEDGTQMLNVAKEIHEIKKDYTRVISGIEKTLDENANIQMSFQEILDIAMGANKKVADRLGKKIDFQAKCLHKGKTENYYSLLSIINNLIINAIEAIEYEGRVKIVLKQVGDMIAIEVSDNGSGIRKEEYDLIFKAGYSTKYNMENGIMSSGIGLTHVKTLVEEVLEGEISVKSGLQLAKNELQLANGEHANSPQRGSVFTVLIPMKNLLNPNVL